LIHQRNLAPLPHHRHRSAAISLCATRHLSGDGVPSRRHRGLGPGPKSHAEADRKPIADRMRDWIDEQRAYAARVPRRYATLEAAMPACAKPTLI